VCVRGLAILWPRLNSTTETIPSLISDGQSLSLINDEIILSLISDESFRR